MWVSACSFRQYLEQHTITRHGNQIHVVCQLSECPSQWWIWLMYLVLEINIVMSSSLFMLITYYSVVTGQERLVLTIECVEPVWTDQITQTTTKTQAGCIQNCLHLRGTMWWAAWFRNHIAAPLFPYNQCLISGNPCLSWDSSHYKQSHVLIHVEWTAMDIIWIE